MDFRCDLIGQSGARGVRDSAVSVSAGASEELLMAYITAAALVFSRNIWVCVHQDCCIAYSMSACITHNIEESGQDLEMRFVLAVLAVSTSATWRGLAPQLVLYIHVESVTVVNCLLPLRLHFNLPFMGVV
jgi:hypothetical protein